ncbi:MAG: dephospho-CoA kinase [Candidatus Omnitrophota bacterium]
MLIVGVTGGFGTGKSTVAADFKKFGAVVLDADVIAHRTMEAGGSVAAKIIRSFGPAVVGSDGLIDRRALGKIVFKERRKLRRLCAIVHPMVIRAIERELAALRRRKPRSIVVLDVPLLIEAGMLPMVDLLVVVTAKRSVQIERCRARTGLTRAQIMARIRAQMSMREKIKHSDFCIDTSGKKTQTHRKVKTVWEQIQQLASLRKRTSN